MSLESAQQAQALEPDERVIAALASINPAELEATVRAISYPRHADAQPEANRTARLYISERLTALGYVVEIVGDTKNVVAIRPEAQGKQLTLVGAHYDSVPGTPGADDNASAVAALIGCADAVARHAPETPACFVSFNREEDGLVGSQEFARTLLPGSGLDIRAAHILEMVGYRDRSPGSQKAPLGLPVPLPDTGDWLGLVGNAASIPLIDAVLSTAKTYLSETELPVFGLKLPPMAEKLLPVLQRSDHAPFWEVGIPALQWTDTAEFRNPHYHQPTDTPETLDYEFLASVTRLITACVIRP